jgi:hypothetical protein
MVNLHSIQHRCSCFRLPACTLSSREHALCLQAVYAEQMLRHAGERTKARAIASKRAFVERRTVRSLAVRPRVVQVPAVMQLLHCVQHEVVNTAHIICGIAKRHYWPHASIASVAVSSTQWLLHLSEHWRSRERLRSPARSTVPV